jgi:hypothetical protein
MRVNPANIGQFGSPEGSTFCLVTNKEVADRIEVVEDAEYVDYRTVLFDDGDFEQLLQEQVPEPAHVLAISPMRFFESPPANVLGPRRKLLAMACNSTPADFATVAHFMRVIEATDPQAQEDFSANFFEAAENGEHLEYRDSVHGTCAILRHFDKDLVWNQQAGLVDWGEQQIIPSGEISVLPIDITEFDESLSLPLDGEIVIRGYPILHSGTPSFTRSDQDRIYQRLKGMASAPIKAVVEAGRITDLTALAAGAEPAVEMLEAMFAVDSRYRIVWEIGHALNTELTMLPGNHAMNEVYGGTTGCLHWGLGLTPFTQFHLDIISPGTVVTNDQGEALLGTPGESAPERIAVPA